MMLTRQEQQGCIKSSVEGPCWAGIKSLLIEVSRACELSLEMTEDKGWVRTRIYFEVKGPMRQLERFRAIIQQAVKEYEED